MKVLGVYDGHTATAALLEDGEIKAVISEERINRVKEYFGFPAGAIKRVLQITNTDPWEIDIVVMPNKTEPLDTDYVFNKKLSIKTVGFNSLRKIFPRTFMSENYWTAPAISLISLFKKKKKIYNFFKKIGIPSDKIVFADHHTCHAYTTLTNPWAQNDDALIITLDGSGDGYCSTVNILEDSAIKNIEKTNVYNSLGFLYSMATKFLNMKPFSHEYKVMGLAAYSKPENSQKVYEKLKTEYIRINPKNPLRMQNISGCVILDYLKKFKKDFSEERFDNFAGGLQKFTEDLIVKYVSNCIRKTNKHTVFLSGGVFMNVKANMKIMYETDIKRLLVFPSCSDESNSIGACNYGYYLLCKKKGIKANYAPLKNVYFGDEFSNEEIRKELEQFRDKLNFSFKEDINRFVAKKLAQEQIVARFNGRMEFGARALGNRSILANPASKDAVREINDAIKMRDFWMPFAGTILDEDKNKYLVFPENIQIAPAYMILAFKTKEIAKKEIPSAIHQYDLTCRPQILKKENNPEYYQLIRQFKNLTGIGALLNTSFNIHGDPIVRTPRDAIETLLKSDLKNLAIGNYFVEKK